MRLKNYTFVDYATQGYLALVGLIILFLHGQALPDWPVLFAGHVLGLGLIHLLIRFRADHPGHGGVEILRHFYPLLLFGEIYRETAALNHLLYSGFLDPFFIRLEGHLFGLQPSLVFMERLPYLPVSELLYAAYFSYYLMLAGIGLALFFRNREQFFHYLSVVSFVFYVCLLIYIFLPVVGPRIFFPDITHYSLPADVLPASPPFIPAAITVGPFYRLMAWIYLHCEAPGAAFPSSHVAVGLTTLFFSFRYLRRIRWVHLVAVMLLCLGTVYGRYHYAIDVLAGGLTAALLIPLGNRLYFKFLPADESARLQRSRS